MKTELDYRDLADSLAMRLQSCYSILDNLSYLCKDVQIDGIYNLELHDYLVMLVSDSLNDMILKLRTVSRGDQIES